MSGTLILKTKIPFKIGKKSLKFLVTCDTRKIEGDDDVTEIILNEGNGIIRGEIETKEIEYMSIVTEHKEIILIDNIDISDFKSETENQEIVTKVK